MENHRTEVLELSRAPEELAFTVAGPFGRHRIRFWGDLPASGEGGVEAALAVAIVPAMASGGPLVLPDAPDPRLRRSLADIQAVLSVLAEGCATANRELTPVEIVAPNAPPVHPAPAEPAKRVGVFFSGGVDSFEAALCDPEVTDLIYVHGFDIPLEKAEASASVEVLLSEAAAGLGKRLRVVRTDLRKLIDPIIDWQIGHGPALAAAALLFEPVCCRVVIGSTTTYAVPAPRGSHPLHDHLWSTRRLQIEHRGAYLTRTEKIERVARSRHALGALRVCWEDVESFNCGRCEKCLRTMVALESLGALERCPTFAVPLELDAVRRLRFADPKAPIWWEENLELARGSDGSPELIAAVKACLAANRAPPRPDVATELRERLAAVEERAADLDRLLGEILSSHSWRLAAPLRRIGDLVRRLARRR